MRFCEAVWRGIRLLGCLVGLHAWTSAALRGEIPVKQVIAATAFGEDTLVRLFLRYLKETCRYCDAEITYHVEDETDA